MKAPHASAPWLRYRFAVASRALAAVAGGYGCASAAAAALAVWLPVPRVDAALGAQMAAFVVYTAAIVWVFATHNAWRAWMGMALSTATFFVLYLAGRGAGL